MTPTLTLAFACSTRNLSDLLNRIRLLMDEGLDQLCDVLIVVQCVSNGDKSLAESERALPTLPKKIKVLFQEGKGLSRSRNLALAECGGEFVWILDDDVGIKLNSLKKIVACLAANKADVFLTRIECSDRDGFYKNYERAERLSAPYGLLRRSSIELIFRTNFYRDKGIRFDEKIGLGTEFPGCEEPHFLLQLWNHGARFEIIPIAAVLHTCLLERHASTRGVFYARGYVLRQLGLRALPVLVYWAGRFYRNTRSFSNVRAMFFGFFVGLPTR